MAFTELDREISSIDGRRKQNAIRSLYKLVDGTHDGFFNDDYWKPVNDIQERLNEAGVKFYRISSDYRYDEEMSEEMPSSKIWKFQIPIRKRNGHDDLIHMVITAHGAGSVDQPLDRYDVTVTFS